MSNAQVVTDTPTGDGSDIVWLDTVGQVENLRWSWSFPGGPVSASWNLDFPELGDHTAFVPGRTVRILAGSGRVWSGTLGAPERGTPWSFTALGAAAAGKRFRAHAPTSGNAANLDEIIDAGAGRGLPWVRRTSIVAASPVFVTSGSQSVDEALSAYTDRTFTYWWLDDDNVIQVAAAPTAPTHILGAQDVPGGRTLQDFITDVYVTYYDMGSAKQLVVVANTAARTRFGVVEDILDLTPLGPMSTADATSYGQDYLAKKRPRLAWTAPLNVAPGELLNMGGAPVDLATLLPPVRLLAVNLEPDGQYGDIPDARTPTILVGGYTYDDTTGAAEIIPAEFRPRDFRYAIAEARRKTPWSPTSPTPVHHPVTSPRQRGIGLAPVKRHHKVRSGPAPGQR